jgi:hypothetical protein
MDQRLDKTRMTRTPAAGRKTVVCSAQRLATTPAVRHADALIDGYGVDMARAIARMNSAVHTHNDYWHKVLHALSAR